VGAETLTPLQDTLVPAGRGAGGSVQDLSFIPQYRDDLDVTGRRDLVTSLGHPAYRADQVSRHYFVRFTDDDGTVRHLAIDGVVEGEHLTFRWWPEEDEQAASTVVFAIHLSGASGRTRMPAT
jgi:hypothetical protein